ncbi:MAG: DivIVA domain-containing protein [Oscillospiraceae bacterium]|nr:DivIVA domain-containing protein [Oscillospiraceae bacterium]
MLTPQEITDKEFAKAVFGGYVMAGVDGFLESLTEDYSALYKENAILKSKIKVLVEKVEEYRSTEDSMRMALLTAQKMGDDILADANKTSADIIKRAETESEDKMNRLKARMDDEEERLRAAIAQTEQYVNASRELIRAHLEFLTRLEQIHKEPPPPEPEPEPSREDRIESAVREIDNNVERLVGGGTPEPAREYDDDDEPTSPRPKFNFGDLGEHFGK